MHLVKFFVSGIKIIFKSNISKGFDKIKAKKVLVYLKQKCCFWSLFYLFYLPISIVIHLQFYTIP